MGGHDALLFGHNANTLAALFRRLGRPGGIRREGCLGVRQPLPQVGYHLTAVLVAAVGVLGHGVQGDLLQTHRHIGIQTPQRLGVLLHLLQRLI